MLKIIRMYGSILLVFTIFFGCGSITTRAVGEKSYPPRYDSYRIDVYCMKPPRKMAQDSLEDIKKYFNDPFEHHDLIPEGKTIGRIEIKGPGSWDWGRLIIEAKKKARALGGDAIVITRYDYYETAGGMAGNDKRLYGRQLFTVVMRYASSGL